MSKYSEINGSYMDELAIWDCYSEGLKEGDVKCAYGMAECLQYGFGIEQDECRANKLFAEYFAPIFELAQKGDAEAKYIIGQYYDNGFYVKEDKSIAIEWYTKAAEQGYAPAQNTLAYCYKNGEGVEQDYKKAVEWYTKAAEQGYTNAQVVLARCYECGEGIEQNYEKAIQWYLLAEQEGNIFASSAITSSCESGWGIEVLQKFAKQGNLKAARNLYFYYVGDWGGYLGYSEVRNLEKAIEWLQKAAEQGDTHSQYDLSVDYFRGEGVEKDYKKAIELLTKVAEQGDPFAQYELAKCYKYGHGVEIDCRKAIEWFQKTVEHADFCSACYELAEMYYNADNKYNIGQDYGKAIKWANKAIECEGCNIGDPYYLLGDCYHMGLGVEVDLSKAKEYYQKAKSLDYKCDYALEMVKRDLGESKKYNSVMKACAEKIKSEGVPYAELHTRIKNDLSLDFAEIWDTLRPTAQNSLVSGVMVYINFYMLGKEVYSTIDFSAAIMPMAKALEITLAEFFHTGYIRYLKYKNIPPEKFAKKNLPLIKRCSAEEQDKTEYESETYTENFTLGSLPFVIEKEFRSDIQIAMIGTEGFDKFRSVAYRKKDNQEKGRCVIGKFATEYAKELFRDDAFDELNHDRNIVDYLISLSDDVTTIKNQRNKAAHDKTMSIEKAEVCGDYLIKVQKMIYNFVSKIKPQYRKGYQPRQD